MMKKFGLDKTHRVFTITAVLGGMLIMSLMIVIMIVSARQHAAATNKAVSKVSTFYLEGIADRRSKTIENLINDNFAAMDKAVAYIRDEDIGSQEELRGVIGMIKSLLSLNRFALVDEADIVYTQYTTYTGRSRHDFLNGEALSGRIIRTVPVYGSTRQLCLVIPTEGLSILGRDFKACFIQIDLREIVDLLAFDDKDRTYFALYSSTGRNLSDTELGPVIGRRNLLEAAEALATEEEYADSLRRFGAGAEGGFSFSYDDSNETMTHVPVPGTGWQLAVLTRESVINEQFRDISENSLAHSRLQIIVSAAAVVALAVILLLELMYTSRRRLEAEKETSQAYQKMANTDSLTGVRNKHAYTEREEALDRLIREKSVDKLGVVICDINGLKYVNDTRGHEAGDQLIRESCRLICDVFSHGAVFRTGGDEFTVVLMDRGFDTLEEDLRHFNELAEAHIATGEAVVSAGTSSLQPDDTCLADVCARADQLMYERKKQLKEMGAHTRL